MFKKKKYTNPMPLHSSYSLIHLPFSRILHFLLLACFTSIVSQVNFRNKVTHPNISANGAVYLNLLKDNWSPAFTILTVLDFYLIYVHLLHIRALKFACSKYVFLQITCIFVGVKHHLLSSRASQSW